ncbi:hypothetical protein [Actinacidiphila acididurans]|uniref:Uncharacterized protein n=1 Tax=Actinacidiphila acididurans TaxID=2784346 RepID=A0ABS2U096_9ACTN|nr:hypothetical protein [Actinacidiphila acididurans]MBM9509028.1 hypothetical protein [Actinacidiphila acididurans]
MGHWHAYTYTGVGKPPEGVARDPMSPTPPILVREWLRKPRAMMVGTFTEAGAALGWLAAELEGAPPLPTSLPVETTLGYARERLGTYPYDQVTRYWTPGGYVCRDLVWCDGTVGVCPDPR